MQQVILKNGKNLIIGLKMKEIREKFNLTQDELSKMLDISKSLISRIEQGAIESIQHSTIIKLVENLNISLEWLLFDEGDMVSQKIDISQLILEKKELEQQLDSKASEIQKLKNQVDILIRAVGSTK